MRVHCEEIEDSLLGLLRGATRAMSSVYLRTIPSLVHKKEFEIAKVKSFMYVMLK